MKLQELELKNIYGGGIQNVLGWVVFGIFRVMKSYLRFTIPRFR